MEERIRETFYNAMFNMASSAEWITYDKLRMNQKVCKGLIILTMMNIISLSKEYPTKIVLFDQSYLSMQNCPNEFKELLTALIQLKTILDVRPDSDLISITTFCLNKLEITHTNNIFNNNVQIIAQKLLEFSNIIYEKQIFKVILERIAELFQSMKTKTVSEKLIRDTFYNMMVNEALEMTECGYMTKDDLEMNEAFIFLDLTSFTTIAACILSKNMDGIILLDRSVLNANNCPVNYKELITIILQLKPLVSQLNQNQIKILKSICSSNPYLASDNGTKSSLLTMIASNINQISTKVSQRKTFKDIIMDVINFSIEIQ